LPWGAPGEKYGGGASFSLKDLSFFFNGRIRFGTEGGGGGGGGLKS